MTRIKSKIYFLKILLFLPTNTSDTHTNMLVYKLIYITKDGHDSCPVMSETDSNYIDYCLIFITHFTYSASCDISGFSTFTTSIWATYLRLNLKVSSAEESNFAKLARTSIIIYF